MLKSQGEQLTAPAVFETMFSFTSSSNKDSIFHLSNNVAKH